MARSSTPNKTQATAAMPGMTANQNTARMSLASTAMSAGLETAASASRFTIAPWPPAAKAWLARS